MGEWINTVFVHEKDPDRFFRAAERLFEWDGYRYVPGLLTISEEEARQMQYGQALESRIWAVQRGMVSTAGKIR